MKLKRKIAKKDSIERKKMKNIIFEKLKEKKAPPSRSTLKLPNPTPFLAQV
jgi:hypothetical protein